jgi:hypothetical protein
MRVCAGISAHIFKCKSKIFTNKLTSSGKIMRLFISLLWLFTSMDVTAQSINISPTEPHLIGEPISIKLVGFPPKVKVHLRADRVIVDSGKNVDYIAEADFTSDDRGEIDLSQAAPITGSYKRPDVRGLFWSMRPKYDTAAAASSEVKVKTSQLDEVKLIATIDGKEVAGTTLQLRDTKPEVRFESIGKFPGSVFASLPGKEKRPVVIVLGGSDGGSKVAREMAGSFAAHGFSSIGLAYYSPGDDWSNTVRELPSLPRSFVDIPVDRLEEVYTWLKSRGDVDSDRIAIWGYSKGAEFALIAASKMPWVKTVAAIAPSDVVWQGWGPDVIPLDSRRSSFSYAGKALPFVPNQDFPRELSGFQTGADIRFRRPQDKGRAASPAAAVAARIRVEDFKGSLLVAGGIEDQMWASGMMAQNIAERRAEMNLETVALIYTDVGHMLKDKGWNPTTQYDVGAFKTGGTPEANAKAQAEIWKETLVFFKRELFLK